MKESDVLKKLSEGELALVFHDGRRRITDGRSAGAAFGHMFPLDEMVLNRLIEKGHVQQYLSKTNAKLAYEISGAGRAAIANKEKRND
jgi:hypothetical protein